MVTFGVVVAPLVAAGCGGNTSSIPPDASMYSDGSIAEGGEDATEEMAVEASSDAGSDVTIEAGVDSAAPPADAEMDSPEDAGVDADAGPAGPTAVVSDAPGATALLTDGTDLFWIDSTSGDAGPVGRVMKVAIGGGAEVTLATTQGTPTERVAIDSTRVYFTDGTDTVWVVPKTGGAAAVLATSDQFAPLTAAAGFAYYGSGAGIARVSSAADSGVDAGTVLTSTGTPVDLVVVAGHVFWANPSAGALQYVSASSGGPPVILLAPGPEAGVGEFVSGNGAQNLVTNGTSLYWNRAPSSGVPGAIMSLAVGGGAPSVLVNTGTDVPFSLVTDGNSAFYLDLGTTTSLVKVPLATGAAVTLTTSSLAAADIAGTPGPTVAVDATHVYWLNPPQILSLPK